MKILCISDLHGSHTALRRILGDAGEVDMVLFGGDLTTFGTPRDVESLIQQAQLAAEKVYAVAGNCDSALIDEKLVDLGASAHGRGIVEGDVGIHGASGIPPWFGRMYEFSEDEMVDFLSAGHAQLGEVKHHIVLCHAPPSNGSVDRTSSGAHAGSGALRTFIEKTQPILVICGHVHEARGIERIGETTVVNCGPGGNGFYVLVDLDDEINVELCQV